MSSPVSTERFQPLRVLGHGGHGVVWEALDKKTGDRVAMKLLRRPGAEAVYRLKQEFRVLADVRHPQLVRLRELFRVGEEWFFSMDLVHGQSLHQWVRGDEAPSQGSEGSEATGDPIRATTNSMKPLAAEMGPGLLDALRSLVAAVGALHARGRLHCDLKPANLLVQNDGTVVILDFGLAVRQSAVVGPVAGSVPYLAPEQASGGAVTPATDWYAVGVIAFQLITGRLPFTGVSSRILTDKQHCPAPSVRSLVPYAPDDLAQLIDGLLQTDPSNRPTESDIRAFLGMAGSEPPASWPFVGREQERARLEQTWRRVQEGEHAVVWLSCDSGGGKTALAHHFLDGLCTDALVVRVRCFERERMGLRAFDPVVDAISAWLEARPEDFVRAVLPRHVRALADLFPALDRLPAAAETAERTRVRTSERVARGMLAFRELLARISEHTPVAILLDDFQWADVDSARMLRDVLSRPDCPSVLWIVAFRPKDDSVPRLREIVDQTGPHPGLELSLTPLDATSSCRLATSIAGEGPHIEALRDAARGVPFLLVRLAQRVRREGSLRDGDWLDVELTELEPPALAALQRLALVAVPVSDECVGLQHTAHLESLVGAGLVVRRSAGALACAHDRVREGVRLRMGEEDCCDAHRALAERGVELRPIQRAAHWLAAGEPDRAYELAVAAARHAESRFDWQGAMAAWDIAAACCDEPPLFVLEGRGHAARMLADHRAVRWLEDAAVAAPPGQSARLRIHAADAALASFDRAGFQRLVGEALPAFGLRWPAGRLAAIAQVLLAWLRVQLPVWRVRPLTPTERTRMEVADQVGLGLALSDETRSAMFLLEALHLAQKSSATPDRALALSTLAALDAAQGAFDRARTRLAVLPPYEDPKVRAIVLLRRAVVDLQELRFRSALSLVERANVLSVRTDHDVGEASLRLMFELISFFWLGRLSESERRQQQVLSEHHSRMMRLVCHIAVPSPSVLRIGDVAAAERHVAWSNTFMDPHWGSQWWVMWTSRAVGLHLYKGEYATAAELLSKRDATFWRTGLHRTNVLLVEWTLLWLSVGVHVPTAHAATRRVARRAARRRTKAGFLFCLQPLLQQVDAFLQHDRPRAAAALADSRMRFGAETPMMRWALAYAEALWRDDPHAADAARQPFDEREVADATRYISLWLPIPQPSAPWGEESGMVRTA